MFRVHFCALILITMLAAGCKTRLPPAADSERARSAVQTVLDTWQKGEKLESLKQQDPAIHVNEPAWSRGDKLVKYEILSEHPNGQSRRCEVVLTVQQGNKPPVRQEGSYTIDTDPAIVVVRD